MPCAGGDLDKPTEQVQVDNLSRRLGRYNLVVAVSKRARDLKERIDSALVPSSATLIGKALREISEGKVKLLQSAEKPEGEEEE